MFTLNLWKGSLEVCVAVHACEFGILIPPLRKCLKKGNSDFISRNEFYFSQDYFISHSVNNVKSYKCDFMSHN